MKFGQLMKTHSPELVISRRYDAWMQTNSNPTYSDEAIRFGQEQFIAQRTPRDRKGTISGSSMGKCKRRQQFTFIGVPEMEYSPKVAAYFVNGTFMHIRWQMAGITEGWLPQAEVPVPPNELKMSGTMDGIAYDGSVVEFKSANTYAFSRVTSFGPQQGHEEQLATYVLATGAEKAVLLYENKNDQDYKEFVFSREELPLETVMITTERLWHSIETKTLEEPLDAAYEMKQPCSGCIFRDNCLSIMSWNQAEEMADAARQ